jgi:hypothetical protein
VKACQEAAKEACAALRIDMLVVSGLRMSLQLVHFIRWTWIRVPDGESMGTRPYTVDTQVAHERDGRAASSVPRFQLVPPIPWIHSAESIRNRTSAPGQFLLGRVRVEAVARQRHHRHPGRRPAPTMATRTLTVLLVSMNRPS